MELARLEEAVALLERVNAGLEPDLMSNPDGQVEPHVGTPIVARAEAEAARLAREARKAEALEPFECHLADAYAKLLSGQGRAGPRAPSWSSW